VVAFLGIQVFADPVSDNPASESSSCEAATGDSLGRKSQENNKQIPTAAKRRQMLCDVLSTPRLPALRDSAAISIVPGTCDPGYRLMSLRDRRKNARSPKTPLDLAAPFIADVVPRSGVGWVVRITLIGAFRFKFDCSKV
jgi:hypothetical protein